MYRSTWPEGRESRDRNERRPSVRPMATPPLTAVQYCTYVYTVYVLTYLHTHDSRCWVRVRETVLSSPSVVSELESCCCRMFCRDGKTFVVRQRPSFLWRRRRRRKGNQTCFHCMCLLTYLRKGSSRTQRQSRWKERGEGEKEDLWRRRRRRREWDTARVRSDRRSSVAGGRYVRT